MAESEAEAANSSSETDSPAAEAPAPETAPASPAQSKETDTPPAPTPDTADSSVTLEQLQQALGNSNFKNHNALHELRQQLKAFQQQLDGNQQEMKEQAQALHEQLQEMAKKNRQHQEQLAEKTMALVESLKQALEAGQSHEALPTWDKIQGNISNTSGKVRAKLQELSNPFKAQLNELRDWKIFAATEKKRELIQQMQTLLETKVDPQELNKRIGNLHRQWKALGQANEEETLWKEFKAISDKAYEPCREYFKQRKQLMVENHKKRLEICDLLEAELEKLEPEEIHIGQINKLLSRCEKQWKQHAPVEQSKIKQLQKRYYSLVNQFRKHRKKSIRENSARKQALIDQAEQLVSLEDNNKAMSEAKGLQKDWQAIGPTTFKDDKKLWAKFRAACDKIFARRDEAESARKQEQQQQRQQLVELLDRIETLLKQDDEAFRETRAEFHELTRQFNSKLDARQRRSQGKLLDRFNDLKRQADSRYRALPDKKTQALLQQVEAAARELEAAEAQLLNSQDKPGEPALNAELGTVLAGITDEQLHELLSKRKQLIENGSADLAAAAEHAEKDLRELCINGEIRADMETPAEDQARRMELQLAQLQAGFGQSRPSQKENTRFAIQAQMQARCIGPLPSATRQALSKRLQEICARLR